MYQSVSMPEFDQLYRRNPDIKVLDVREDDEYQLTGHIPGAQSLPLSSFPEAVKGLPKNQSYYVICQSGGRSSLACSFLGEQGYNVTNVMGGMSAWRGERE